MKESIIRKVTTILMTAILILMMVTPAFAQNYMTDGYGTAGSFKQGQASAYNTTSAVHVTVTIESKKQSNNQIAYRKIPVTLPAVSSPGTSYTVRDALLAVQSDTNNNLQFLDDDGDPITNTTTYFKSVKDTANNVTYSPSGSLVDYDGWFFRLNGRIALHYLSTDSNPLGGTIADTYLTDGDEINVYFDNVYSSTLSCRVNRIFEVNYLTDGSDHYVTVNVKKAYDYFTPLTYAWHIYNFDAANGVSVEVFDSSNSSKGTGTTDSSGDAIISVPALTAGGTYTVYAYGSAGTLSLSSSTDSVEFTVPTGNN